ncbi:sensor domain-containing diguanylate cyclase [Acidovorax sp. sic0104]|uniref:sensor domain-containing diguanylate cyclase n=1 Tax=Acidovorax sp. sic0104 TaxID=2854784 RepID=UPI001C439760|nr:sensor domain-containing diguanylate cyclase [Acidovorax sp. sic0104]MBV7543090.1 sensor domain-containing diguanylate cyclase [Acidovorax sp. sic0104]
MPHDIDLLQALPAAVLVTQNGVVRFANAAGAQLLGFTEPDSLRGQMLAHFVHPLDQRRSHRRVQEVAGAEQAGRPNKASEFRVRTLQGHLRMVLVSSVAIDWHGGPAVLMTGMDMTHQSEIEAELRESEQNFRRLFETMQDVYYRTNAQGVVQQVGPGVRRVLGYEPHEIEGRTAESYYPHSSDRDAFKAAILAHGEVSDFPGQMVRRDGQVIDISISSHALYDPAGNFAGVEGIYRDVTQRKNLERELQRLATTDMLTGMANRRAFLECAESVYAHSLGNGEPLTLLMLDLDHFKSINDRFGHLEGDRALVEFAQAVKSQLRASDVVGRLGGEEFGVLLPLTAIEEGLEVAARILASICALRLTDDTGQAYGITASMGLGAFRHTDRSLRDALDRADQALYLAKHRGRNQVASLEPTGPQPQTPTG